MHPSPQAIRVMLVDDHPTMLWGLEKLIQGEWPRMEVVGTARTCEEAQAKARQLAPDVILLDLGLGQQSAITIIPALLSNPVSRILVLTSEQDQATLDLAVQHGARGLLTKTAAAEQVLKAIEKIHHGEIWLDHNLLSRVFGKMMQPKPSDKTDPELERTAALTPRERKVVGAIVRECGASNKLTAEGLFISEHTLRNHLTSIYQKLGVSNRLELYIYAVRHQLGNVV